MRRLLLGLALLCWFPIQAFALTSLLKNFDTGLSPGFYHYQANGATLIVTNDYTTSAAGLGSMKIISQSPGKGAYSGIFMIPYWISPGLHSLTNYIGGGMVIWAKAGIESTPLTISFRLASQAGFNPNNIITVQECQYIINLSFTWKKFMIPFSSFPGMDLRANFVGNFGFVSPGIDSFAGVQTINVDEISFLDAADFKAQVDGLPAVNKELTMTLFDVSPPYIYYKKQERRSANILYKVTSDCQVTILITDLSGNEVALPVNSSPTTANIPYSYVWDGMDKNGKSLETGVYQINLIYKFVDGSIKRVKSKQIIICN